ncbi:YjcZ family sporulation protein [Bacillus sp. FJAT-29790]|nr:YjcZ family sporulation protein [Bacillus sp. FJAT-29790]
MILLPRSPKHLSLKVQYIQNSAAITSAVFIRSLHYLLEYPKKELSSFALIVVMFILLILVGSSFMG